MNDKIKNNTITQPLQCKIASHNEIILTRLIAQLITIYGGNENEWMELAIDNLDEAIKCFALLVEEN